MTAFAACTARPLRIVGDEGDLLKRFDFSDPSVWRRAEGGGGGLEGSLELAGASAYVPPHRSPLAIALLAGVEAGDFRLAAQVRSTAREYGHRDLCLFFGFVDPAHFYYVHLASAPDERAHNVFLVDGADRRALLPVAARGVDWSGERWRSVRLERHLEDGAIRVWLDDELVFDARDRTLGRGRVGFGSFDDTGAVRAIVLTARDARRGSLPDPFAGSGASTRSAR